MEAFLWFWAVLIVWGCIWILFRPMYWSILGGAVGYFIGKNNIPTRVMQEIKTIPQRVQTHDDATYYKRLAQEMLEQNINLRKQINNTKH